MTDSVEESSPSTEMLHDIGRGARFRWRIREVESFCQSSTAASQTGFLKSSLLARILAARGRIDLNLPESELKAAIDSCCATSLRDVHEVSRLPNVEHAAERIVQAIRNGEHIVIYGDYDVDGITATAILYHTIRLADPNVNLQTYVPDRISEGYGLNADAIRQLADEGVNLMITVDCGITARDEAALARELGVDLIITDHHHLPVEPNGLPANDAILVHPRLPGSAYPFGELCGAGVAFKLAWRIATVWCGSERVSQSYRDLLTELLAFVALGTIADVVPLVDENRILARNGLSVIRHTSFVGLNALIQAAGLADERNIDTDAVGFRLAPRLNACGRMGHAREAVELFTSAQDDVAERIAHELNRQNSERQATERRILVQAQEMAEAQGMTGNDRRIIVLAHPDWHPGVVGIVCSRLVEQFGRPVILLQHTEEGICRGSGRSIDGYSLHDALAASSEHLRSWGGHEMAAGLSLYKAALERFVDSITTHANQAIALEDLVPALTLDCAVEFAAIDARTVRDLQRLGPFGRMNPSPTVLLRNVRVQGPPQYLGGSGKHIAVLVAPSSGNVRSAPGHDSMLRLVGWNMGPFAPRLQPGQVLDVVVKPRIDRWRGESRVQCELRDFRPGDVDHAACR